MEMPSKDRALLRSVVIAAITGTASSLLVAVSCLGLAGPRSSSTTSLTSASEAITETVSSGDAAATAPSPAEAPTAQVSTTAPPSDTETRSEGEAFDAGARTLPPPAQQVPVATAPPAATARAVPEAGASTASQGQPEAGTLAQNQQPEAGASGAADAGPPPLLSTEFPYSYNRPPSPMLGAGDFTTTPPSWTSSAWVPNPNAGAGQFTTEWNTPIATPTLPLVGIPGRDSQQVVPATPNLGVTSFPEGTPPPPALGVTTPPAVAQ